MVSSTDRSYYEHLINKGINANRYKYIHFLHNIIQAASPNPPGDTHAAKEVIKNFLSRRHIRPRTFAALPHAPNLVVKFEGRKGRGPQVLFNGHIDTFPVNGETASQLHPCSWLIAGERIHGLGAVDMKASMAASVIAFTLLEEYSRFLTGSVVLTAVSDETGGRYGTQYLLDSCGDVERIYVVINGEPEGLQSFRLGEKGG
jgi:succinyl-diaminopimelate desuccinylase